MRSLNQILERSEHWDIQSSQSCLSSLFRLLMCKPRFRFEEIFTTSERLATRSPSLTPGHAPNQLEAPKHLTVLAQRNFRTVPCWPFHLQNHCYKGNKCTYSHDPVTEEAKDGLRIRYAADMAAKKQSEYLVSSTSGC